jgi:hypothetical protein
MIIRGETVLASIFSLPKTVLNLIFYFIVIILKSALKSKQAASVINHSFGFAAGSFNASEFQ